ncbi:MAG TPA: DUF952 domain-containing protein [Chloroflexia bacterium]|nr:DUF952 domain-containing protein [Chloroflexia bacterium]
METFYHIVHQATWEQAAAAGEYRPDSVEAEGFIHCSYRSQILLPANLLYHGQTGLVLLCIDPIRVTAEVRQDRVEVM